LRFKQSVLQHQTRNPRFVVAGQIMLERINQFHVDLAKNILEESHNLQTLAGH
jgi:hypothetical protein